MADHDTHDHAGVPGVGTSTTTVATDTLWDAKGDLAAGTGANTASKLTVGADDTILMADSGQATGLKWVASASPSAVGTAAATGTADTFTRGDHVHAHEAAHVAHDTIWDTAGDLVVGSGADTAAKLAIGAVGGALSRLNGTAQWNSGTSNPTGVAGDRYWRSDLGLEICYDGTRWFTTQLFEGVVKDLSFNGVVDPNGTVGIGYYAPDPTYNLYMDRLITTMFVLTTNDGSNYWTMRMQKSTAGNVQTTIGDITTASDTASNWTTRSLNIGAVFDISTHKQIQFVALDTGSPGNLYWAVRFTYRLIIP